uniref:Uncharacterized protein n=1 Tax=Amphiprion percula TaxID=161767 RepID=A0A3P8TPT6_AMPPE
MDVKYSHSFIIFLNKSKIHTVAITLRSYNFHRVVLTYAVFSWGDGEYGKLGHGNSATQKYPKIIQGPLLGKVSLQEMRLVREKKIIANVAWSYIFFPLKTMRFNINVDIAAVTNDGELYTWGEGDFGKLGHGDTNRVYRPKVVEALHGFIIRKVCAGSQSSLALTSAGQVRCCVLG